MKNSQQSLMNLFHAQNNNSQFLAGNNQNLKYILKNFKINNIISHNNCYISKFKTTKNSPERLLFGKTVNAQNNMENTNNHKKVNKFPIRGKIILGNQKKPEKVMEEMIRNKLSKNKQKMNNKVNDIKNNSMNKGTIYRNSNMPTNNTNILGFEFANQISGPSMAGPISYRAPQKKNNNILEDEEYFIYINKNNKNINK